MSACPCYVAPCGAFTDDCALADPELAARLGDLLSDLAREVAAPVEQSA